MGSLQRALALVCIFALNYEIGVNALEVDPNIKTHVAKDGEAPYYCSVHLLGSYFCGCVIISPTAVLTAARCVESKKNNIEIVMGITNIWSEGIRFTAANVTRHEDFDSDGKTNDIAIVEINGIIEFNDKVKALKISKQPIGNGVNVQTIGWRRFGDVPHADQLRVMDLKTTDCKEKLPKIAHESLICTLAKDAENICQENGGGPLVFNKELIGITNWVTCKHGIPSGFVRTSTFYGWINSMLHPK